jgi:hypothetical protein
VLLFYRLSLSTVFAAELNGNIIGEDGCDTNFDTVISI